MKFRKQVSSSLQCHILSSQDWQRLCERHELLRETGGEVAVYWERASLVTSINLTVLHLDNKNLRVSLCVLSHFSHVWLFAILWTVAHRAPLPMEFLRQEYLSGLPCPPPGDLLDPRIEPTSLVLQADSLPTEPPGKPPRVSLPEFKSCLPPH